MGRKLGFNVFLEEGRASHPAACGYGVCCDASWSGAFACHLPKSAVEGTLPVLLQKPYNVGLGSGVVTLDSKKTAVP